MRECLAFDFDGVLHDHAGWCPPGRPGCRFDLGPLRQAHDRGYAVAVMTCGEPPQIARLLRQAGFLVVLDPHLRVKYWDGGKDGQTILVTERKIVAARYIDDRGLQHRFGGDWAEVWAELERGVPAF